MASFNKVILIGNMVADPELKQTSDGTCVTTFKIAVGRKYIRQGEEQISDFFTIVAWRKTAEFVCKYFVKGMPVLICGALQNRARVSEDGSKRYATEIIADEANFVERKNSSSASPPPAPQVSQYNSSMAYGNYEKLGEEEELPF